MDIDYKVFDNNKTGTHHLVIYPGFVKKTLGTTVCGLKMKGREFRYNGMNTIAFWRGKSSCKNCKRAAKV